MKCKCGKMYKKNSSYMCLVCKRIYDKKWREKRTLLGLSVRGKKPSLEWFKQYWKSYYQLPRVKKRHCELMKKYRENPLLRMKHEARWQTSSAITSGKLTRKPCEKCGEVKTQAHHKDYYQPLNITWLCLQCHRKEHAKAEGL